MIIKSDTNIRLGDFNSPAFRLVGAVRPRNRVHNFTPDFRCDVGDAIGTIFKHVNQYKLIMAPSMGATRTTFTSLTKNGFCSILVFPG